MKHKFLSLFIAIVAMTILYSPTFASVTINGIAYELNGKTATVVSGGNYTGTIVIPSSVTYKSVTYSVTSIGNSAFRGCSGLTSVTIGNNVTSIGSYAFAYCSGLTTVTIPNRVTSIGDHAFQYCSGLTSVTIPNSVTSIGSDAFEYCSGFPVIDNIRYADTYLIEAVDKTLSTYTIKDGTKWIGSYAFYNCTGLTSVTIPNSVTSIGEKAFFKCSGLTSVTIGNSVTSIGYSAFAYCTGLTSIEIPNSVTSIEGSAFEGCTGLTSVTIPNSVTSIGSWAFYYCSGLTSVTIPNSVTSIGSAAFYSCTGLTSVTIPNSVTSIGREAFYRVNNIVYTGSTRDNYPWGAKSVNGYVEGYLVYNDATKTKLLGCSSAVNGEIVIPNSVTSIGKYAFSGCSGLTSVTIPNSVPNIGDCAFSGCTGLTSVVWNAKNCADFTGTSTPFYSSNNQFDLRSQITSFTFGDEVERIPRFLCSGMPNLTSVTIPNSVTSIGGGAFSNCGGLTSVLWDAKNCSTSGGFGSQVTSFVFGNEVETIPADCCSGMNITSITIPNSVTSIGGGAFSGCSGLTSIIVENGNSFYDSRNNCNAIIETATNTLIVGCMNTIIPNSVTSIVDYAFSGCTGLTSVTIPNSVTSIGNNVFDGCTGLTSVAINSPDIVGKTYTSSSNIKNIFGSQVTQYIIIIGDDVTSIGNSAFAYCSGLTSVTIPNSVTSIGNNAFYGCSSLTSVEIPNSVTSIGERAFSGCTGLTSITIGNSVTSIVDYAFDGCTGLTSVTIPNSVTSIGSWAFRGCTGLTSVTIGNSVTSIEYNAFSGCTGLTSVTCLAPTPPTCWGSFSGVNCSNIPLYVPMESVSLYQKNSKWKEFNVIGVMFADEVETAVFSATPTDDYGVILEWQAVENAVLYNIDIIQGNDTIRELQFDSNGKLLNSPSNAPSRYPNIHHASTAILSGNGWRYEVNDLDPETNYTYSITVKAENGSVLYTQSIGFTTKEETFIIKFVNWNGEELLVLPEVVKGTTPSYTGETPVRPNTAEYTYTFVGWTPAIVAATSDTTYTATFTATKNSYTITWQNEDGSLIDQTTVEYGVVPTHAEPTKEATEEYTYTFSGWTPAVVAVTGDATYKATFTATKNSYTITWQNEDGSLIDQTTVEYGQIPAHADPVKQNTAEYTYTFTGWTPAVVAVTGDATYTATFSSVVNVYTITVNAVNGQVLGGGEYQYGTTTDLTAIPDEGYVFDQWSDGVTDNPRTITVTGDVEYTALFKSAEGFENIYTSEPVQKVIIDQKVYILRGDKIYNAQGALVK